MKRWSKRLASVLLISTCLSISMLPNGVEAHDNFASHRWAVMSSSTVNGKTVYTCDLAVNSYNLSVNATNLGWNGAFIDMQYAWNNNSNGQVKCEYHDKEEANVFYRCTNTVAAWDVMYGASVTGLTFLSGTHNGTVKECSVNYPNCATRIKMAEILLTPRNDIIPAMGGTYTLTANDRLVIMVHETGHVLNLAHHYSPDVSIMRQGTYFNIGSITTPQAQERTDLASMYNQIYN